MGVIIRRGPGEHKEGRFIADIKTEKTFEYLRWRQVEDIGPD